MDDVQSMSFVAIGRKYGVSENAVRKWLRWYEYEREAEERERQRLAERQRADERSSQAA
jgi:uncharacterized protein YjcR